jgi:hypothetical protein
MVVSRRSKALIIAVVGLALAAAGGFASAEGFRADGASSAALTVETSAGEFDAVQAAMVDVAGSAAGIFTEGAALASLSEEGTRVDPVTAGDDTIMAMVAQTPAPAGPAPDGVAVAAQPILVNERAWSDGVKTVVECTGDVTRTCQANVYGPDGEFILGRRITPSGEAADCEGPCLDATGAPLDAATVTRAQAAVDSGAQTHKVITSAGLPPAPAPVAVTEAPIETEAEVLRHEGE